MSKLIKPMLAEDVEGRSIIFPCWIQPKIDGVRGGVQHSQLYARSLKPHENLHVTKMYSDASFNGFDGEFILGDNPTAPDLCRSTSGAMRRHDSVNDFTFYVFDDIYASGSYENRYLHASERVANLNRPDIKIMPTFECKNMEEYLNYYQNFLSKGYEGCIVRNPKALYKEGRADKHMQVWRTKPFVDFEILIDEIIEGNKNNNEATTNELGRTERSSKKENLVPNGMVGALMGTIIKDVISPVDGSALLKAGLRVKVSPGKMNHKERKYYFENQNEILGQIGKCSMFAIGIKDAPRFPQFESIRSARDM